MRAKLQGDRNAPGTIPVIGSTPPANANRRRFLLGIGAGGAAAVVATAPVLALQGPADAAAVAPVGKGYQETAHVRDYYATTRI